MLLRDFAGPASCARNRAAIAYRAGGGKEYLFCADNLKRVRRLEGRQVGEGGFLLDLREG
jgi:hypothetical protein